MASEPDKNDQDQLRIRDEQSIFLGAWLDQRKEKDKSIFFSAIGIIGFDAVLLLKENTIQMALLLLVSLLFAGLSAAAILLIFHMNANYLSEQIKDRNAPNNNRCLGAVDLTAMLSFLASLLFIVLAIIYHLMHGGVM
jgi:hypothetical protein